MPFAEERAGRADGDEQLSTALGVPPVGVCSASSRVASAKEPEGGDDGEEVIATL